MLRGARLFDPRTLLIVSLTYRDLHELGHPNLFNDRRCARMDDRLRASFSFSQRFAHSGLLTKTPVWYQTLYTFALNLLVV